MKNKSIAPALFYIVLFALSIWLAEWLRNGLPGSRTWLLALAPIMYSLFMFVKAAADYVACRRKSIWTDLSAVGYAVIERTTLSDFRLITTAPRFSIAEMSRLIHDTERRMRLSGKFATEMRVKSVWLGSDLMECVLRHSSFKQYAVPADVRERYGGLNNGMTLYMNGVIINGDDHLPQHEQFIPGNRMICMTESDPPQFAMWDLTCLPEWIARKEREASRVTQKPVLRVEYGKPNDFGS